MVHKDMPESKTYSGGCHCGKVRFEITTELGKVVACNCSICSKKGTLLTFVGASQFKMVSGEEALTDYQFNKMRVHHLFCSTCGVQSFGRGKAPNGEDMVAVNARCLDGVDPGSLEAQAFDGKSL